MTRRHDPMSRRYNEDFTSLDGRRAVMSRLTTVGRRTTRYSSGSSPKELVDLRPDVIVAHSSPVVATLLGQTRNIPIVFVSISDPIGEGFVAKLRLSRWQRYRIYQFRLLDDRKVGGVAQGDCPADHAHCLPLQSPSGRRCRIVFPAPNRRRCLNPKSESRYGVGP